MKRDLHNLNLGFIQLKRNVHFDSTDHDQITQGHQIKQKFLEG